MGPSAITALVCAAALACAGAQPSGLKVSRADGNAVLLSTCDGSTSQPSSGQPCNKTKRFEVGDDMYFYVSTAKEAGVALPPAPPTAAPATPGVLHTVRVSNGRSAYRSQTDVTITTYGAEAWRAYNGYAFLPDADSVLASPSYYAGHEYRTLLRFGNLSTVLPPGAVITSANLTLGFQVWSGGVKVVGYYLSPASKWLPGYTRCCTSPSMSCPNGCVGTAVGWRYMEGGKPWPGFNATGNATASDVGSGATGPGDILPDYSLVIDGFRWTSTKPGGIMPRTVPLHPEVVSRWVASEADNNGLVFKLTQPGTEGTAADATGVGIVSGKAYTWRKVHPIAQYRPQLAITYYIPASATPAFTPISLPATSKAVGRTLFIDYHRGNDEAASGDMDRPYRLIASALEICGEGDTLVLRGGVHPGGVDIYRSRITLTSYPGERAVIAAVMSPDVGIVVHVRDTAQEVTLRGLEIVGSYYYGVLADSRWDWGATTPGSGGDGKTLAVLGAHGLVIEDCVIHSTGTSNIRVKPGVRNVIIRRSVLRNAGFRYRTYGHGVDAIYAPNIRVEECVISDGPGTGVVLSAGTSNATVVRNYISNMGLQGVSCGWYADGDQMDGKFNPGYAQAVGCVVANNIITHTAGAGIGLYAAQGAVVAHNTLHGVAQSVAQPAIVLAPVQTWVNSTWQPIAPCLNVTLLNNIIVKDVNSRKGMHVQIRSWQDCCGHQPAGQGLGNASWLASGGNVYWDGRGLATSLTFQWGHGVMLEDERVGSAWVGNLTGWRARYTTPTTLATPSPGQPWQLGTMVEVGSVEGDPVLQAQTWAPMPSCSPAVGAGLAPATLALPAPLTARTLGELSMDYWGSARSDNNMTAGAIQPGSTAAVPRTLPQPTYTLAPATILPRPQPSYNWPVVGQWDQRGPRTYVVDGAAGSDSSTGLNATTAWRTIPYAISQAQPGDTIQLRGGTYPGGIALYQPNVTLESYPGEWAKIVAPTNDPSISSALRLVPWAQPYQGSADVTVRRLELVGGYYYALVIGNGDGSGTSNPWYTLYCRFQGKKARGYVLIEDVYMHSAGVTVAKVQPGAHGVRFNRVEVADSGVRGAVATAAAAPAPKIAGSDDVPAPASSGDAGGLSFGSGFGIENRGGHDMVITDSWIHDIRGSGVLMGGSASRCRVERTLVQNVDGIGILIGSFNTEVMYHDVVANPSRHENREAWVANNVVVNATGAGIGLYSATGAVVVHNTLYNVAGKTQAALLFNLSPQLDSTLLQTEVHPPNSNCTLANNLFIQPPGATMPMLEVRTMQASVREVVPPAGPAGSAATCAAMAAASTAATAAAADVGAVGRNPDGSCPIFPPSHPMNTAIDTLPVHAMSGTWVAAFDCTPAARTMGRACGYLQADFGNTVTLPDGKQVQAGIPFLPVNATAAFPTRNVSYGLYPDESDPPGGVGVFSFPDWVPVEGAYTGCVPPDCPGDRHVLLVDTDHCMAYEFWHAQPASPAVQAQYGPIAWTADSGAIFNLTSNRMRPLGWTSADAAGLSIYAGLVRVEEVQAGVIRHAIRMTINNPQLAYIGGLATHYAGYTKDASRPPMGLRLRLKATYDCSRHPGAARIICTALKSYGLIIADGGSDGYISGEASTAWAPYAADLQSIKTIPISALEAVDSGPICYTPDCTPPVQADPLPFHPAIADFASITMGGNVYYRQPYPYTPALPAQFIDRWPARLTRWIDLQAWGNHTGNMTGRDREGDPGLDRATLAPLPAVSGQALPAVATVDLASVGLQAVTTDFYGRPRARSTAAWAGALLPALPGEGPVQRVLPVGYHPRPLPSLYNATKSPCDGLTPAPGSPQSLHIYVNTRVGNDSWCAPADPGTPLKTLSQALLRAVPGSTIWLTHGQSWRETGTLAVRGVTITTYYPPGIAPLAPARVVVDTWAVGPPVLTIAPSATDVTLRNIDLAGGYKTTLWVNGAQGLVVINCTIRGSGEQAVLVDIGSSAVAVVNSSVINAGARTHRMGDCVAVRGASDVLVEGSRLSNCRGTAVHVYYGGRRVMVRRNIITSSGRGVAVGTDHPQAQWMDPVTYDQDDSLTCPPTIDTAADPACHLAYDVDVHNNAVRDTDGSAFLLAGAARVRVVGNTAVNVGQGAGAAVALWAVAQWVSASVRAAARNDNITLAGNVIVQPGLASSPMFALHKVKPWWSNGLVDDVPAAGVDVVLTGNLYFRAPLNSSAYTALAAAAVPAGLWPDHLLTNQSLAVPFSRVWYQRNAPRTTAVAGPGAYDSSSAWYYDDSPARGTGVNPAMTSAQWQAAGLEAAALQSGSSKVADPLLNTTLYLGQGSPALTMQAGSPLLQAGAPATAGGTARYVSTPLALPAALASTVAPVALFGGITTALDGSARAGYAGALPAVGTSAPAPTDAAALLPVLPALATTVSACPVDKAQCPSRCTGGSSGCFIPGWHAQVPTDASGMTEAAVWSRCLNSGGMFATGSEWNRRVDTLPVHPLSDQWLIYIGTGVRVWPAFGSVYDGRPNGFIYSYVQTAKVPVSPVWFLYSSESDGGASFSSMPTARRSGYPLLPDLPIEDGGCDSLGDRHMLTIDTDNCVLYETFKTSVRPPAEANSSAYRDPPYAAESGAVWDLTSKADGATGARPAPATYGWTSTDAAGLPVFAGLVHYYETVILREIRHAIRFTVMKSGQGYMSPPATHYAATVDDPYAPPMGLRMRLQGRYNCTSLMTAPEAQVICRALQVYGMILADNGGDGALSGQAHPGWDDSALSQLRRLTIAQFEVVETGAVLCKDPTCAAR